MSVRPMSIWTPEKVSQLINLYEANECLWNYHTEEYKNRMKRDEAMQNVCKVLNITKEQFAKKIHNLRNQYNFELKKKHRRGSHPGASQSKWEYFDRLRFLKRFISHRVGYGTPVVSEESTTHPEQINTDTEESIEKTYLTKTECLSESIEESHHQEPDKSHGQRHVSLLVDEDNEYVEESIQAPSKSNNIPYTTNYHEVNQRPVAAKKRRSANNDGMIARDDHDTFGEFVANELRNLNSDFARKKMKRKIIQSMLEVWNEDDEVNINICLN